MTEGKNRRVSAGEAGKRKWVPKKEGGWPWEDTKGVDLAQRGDGAIEAGGKGVRGVGEGRRAARAK